MSKCWIYHPDNDPMIINEDQAEDYYEQGWFDSPAAFVKTTDFGIHPDDEIGVQILGETLEGIKEAANDAINLDNMDKDELCLYAIKHYGVTLDKRKSTENLIAEIEDLIHGNGE